MNGREKESIRLRFDFDSSAPRDDARPSSSWRPGVRNIAEGSAALRKFAGLLDKIYAVATTSAGCTTSMPG